MQLNCPHDTFRSYPNTHGHIWWHTNNRQWHNVIFWAFSTCDLENPPTNVTCNCAVIQWTRVDKHERKGSLEEEQAIAGQLTAAKCLVWPYRHLVSLKVIARLLKRSLRPVPNNKIIITSIGQLKDSVFCVLCHLFTVYDDRTLQSLNVEVTFYLKLFLSPSKQLSKSSESPSTQTKIQTSTLAFIWGY